MGTITDTDGNEIDVSELFETHVIRCKNWEQEPDICGETCGIEVPLAALRTNSWVNIVLDERPEWFINLRACSEHGRHADPYCSLNCFTRYHTRHDHPHDAL